MSGGARGIRAERNRATSSFGTYLAFLRFNSHTSAGSERPEHRGNLGQLRGVLAVFGWLRQRRAGRVKMRSVSPRMRNMRGMGAGMR